MRASKSAASIALVNCCITVDNSLASDGVSSPLATAATIAADASTASLADLSRGSSNITGELRRGGARRSMQSFSACISPVFASSMTFRVKASASPSKSASIASVVALRDPFGRPEGFPDLPGAN